MAGGLIQIVTYGSQDLYLTGNPDITFFKVVYRRYTNFTIMSKKLEFDDPVGFGKTSTLIVPKIADLMHRCYLEIILPEINLKKFSLNTNIKYRMSLDKAKDDYQTIEQFMNINHQAYSEAYEIFLAENLGASKMINVIIKIFENIDKAIIEEVKLILKDTIYSYSDIALDRVVDRGNICHKEILFNEISEAIKRCYKIHAMFFRKYERKKKKYENSINDNIKFAWIERIGHALIDEIEISIGGQKIDKHYGDWLNIWYELTCNRDLESKYFKMIGNIDILTCFDRKVKPCYKLKIPLQFWFCRFTGCALPLAAIQHQDVAFKVTFKKIQDVAYIEHGKSIKVKDEAEGFMLDEIIDTHCIDIDASLWIDFIYLDNEERKKFAQCSHEYLIDQLQIYQIRDVIQKSVKLVLGSFVHAVTELIWVAIKKDRIENIDGFTKCDYFNYSFSDHKQSGNLINKSGIDIHGYTRVPLLDSNYYNYVQPYEHHNSSPCAGINTYSFALFPEEFQPSGSANFTRLSKIILNLEFSECINDVLNLNVYARNLNIIRFINGMAGLAIVS